MSEKDVSSKVDDFLDGTERMLDVTEVAKMLRVGHAAVYTYVANGQLASFETGRIWIPESAVRLFLEERYRAKVAMFDRRDRRQRSSHYGDA